MTDFYCLTCRADLSNGETELPKHKEHDVRSLDEMADIWPDEYGGESGGG